MGTKSPELLFEYSFPLDYRLEPHAEKFKVPEINRDTINRRVELFRDTWGKSGKIITEGICDTLGIKFSEKQISVWILSNVRGATSAPLTISAHVKDSTIFENVITHELIHRISLRNSENWDFSNDLENLLGFSRTLDTRMVFNHVYVHAVSKHMYLNVFKDDKRLEWDIEKSKDKKNYNKAWEHVEKIGYDEIIQKIKKT